MGTRDMNRRKQVFERLSSDGKILFRYYDTGSLLGLDSRHPEPKSNGSEGGYLRFNNLRDITPRTMDKILARLEEIGITSRPFIVDFNPTLHMSLLKSWLASKSKDKWLAFVAFLSAVKETRGEITFKQALELVKPNLHLLEKAKDLNALERMFRTDLGFITRDHARRTDYAGILEIQRLIEERRTSAAYAHHFKRFDEGVETQAVVRGRRSEFQQGFGFGFSAAVTSLLTEEEYLKFSELARNAVGGGAHVYMDQKVSLLLSSALVNHGTSRAIDLLLFFMERYRETLEDDLDYWRHDLEFERISSYNGQKFTEAELYEAIDDTDYPVEWALMIRQE